MIIDIHTHTFPDPLAERALAQLTGRAQVSAYTDGTNAGLCAAMARAGIDRAAVMPVATKPSQVRVINAWAAEVNAQFSQLTCFGVLHPDAEGWEAEVAQLVADGIRGVKLHPDYQGFFVDEPRLLPLYRAMADAGLLLLLHAGVDIGLPPPPHCPPDGLARVLDAVPGLTVIAAHMGGYAQWDAVEQYLVGRDVYLETSYSLTTGGRAADAPVFPRLTPAQALRIIRAHGADRILFGSDSPWTDQAQALADLRALPLTADELAAILGGNAARVLGIIGP
jgi:predicted TIM-barrel fold metal-dependent hydrolase